MFSVFILALQILCSEQDLKFRNVSDLYLASGVPHIWQCMARKWGAHFTLGPSKECLNTIHDFRQDPHFGLYMCFCFKELLIWCNNKIKKKKRWDKMYWPTSMSVNIHSCSCSDGRKYNYPVQTLMFQKRRTWPKEFEIICWGSQS